MKEFKLHGYIKHIDHLGRIILPKDFRQFLCIQDGAALEISLRDRGIYIEKFQPLNTLHSLCEQYLHSLARNCNVVAAICSTDYVIASRGITLAEDILLSKELQQTINALEPYHYSESSKISLFDNGKYPIDTVYPIGTKKEPLGAVVLLHYRSTSQEEKVCAKLIADILTELITNQ